MENNYENQYHILNGDALREQFPKEIDGKVVVARECLVDGDIKGSSLEELFEARALFISNSYSGFTKEDYYNKTVPEFRKIQNIQNGSTIYLWFEDDLFCQVNFWFVLHLLYSSSNQYSLFLIRPEVHNQYGFGGLNEAELLSCFENKLKLAEADKLSNLWTAYQHNDLEGLFSLGKQLKNKYPFIYSAIEAHIERIPTASSIGRPKQALDRIMQELNTSEFALVFKAFNKREAIYGFGDLQVKGLLMKLEL